MSDELNKIQAELKELDGVLDKLANKIKANMGQNASLNVNDDTSEQIAKCVARIDELKRLEKPLKDEELRLLGLQAEKEFEEELRLLGLQAEKEFEEEPRLFELQAELKELDGVLDELANKIKANMGQNASLNVNDDTSEQIAKCVARIDELKRLEKPLKDEELRLLGLQAEKEFEEKLRLFDLQAEKEFEEKLRLFDLQAEEKLLLELQAEKEFEEEKNKLILILSGEIPPLVEPYLDKLLLKKKQLVRVDDYGNVDWSFFIKEIRYFVEKNIKTKIYINVPEYLDIWIAEVVYTLISNYENSSPAKVRNLDDVSPIDFEHQCADLLNQGGWTARVTQASGDQGIDVIATYENVKAVFQVKKYSQPVGNSAVQEIIAGKAFENAHIAAVVTNATYTASAKQLANATGVFLLHYSELPSFAEKLGLVETE